MHERSRFGRFKITDIFYDVPPVGHVYESRNTILFQSSDDSGFEYQYICNNHTGHKEHSRYHPSEPSYPEIFQINCPGVMIFPEEETGDQVTRDHKKSIHP